MNQTQIFLDSEGDAWFARNRALLGQHDPVGDAIEGLHLRPRRVLEIGCGNGWRLQKLRQKYDCDIVGVDPSRAAVHDASKNAIPGVMRGCADDLPFVDQRFDLVIFGFCLYLCEPEDLFRIVREADRVLQDEGFLIIHDFAPSDRPFVRKYEHCEGVWSHHMDFALLWQAHPWFRVKARVNREAEVVTVLRKSRISAFARQP